jgi:hypothetical protein
MDASQKGQETKLEQSGHSVDFCRRSVVVIIQPLAHARLQGEFTQTLIHHHCGVIYS